MITAHEVENAMFRRAASGAAGYDELAVDDFLDRVIATLNALEQGRARPADALTSSEVVETEFPERHASAEGGYDMDDVDDLLDRVAQRLFESERDGSFDRNRESGGDGLGRDGDFARADDGGVADAAALASAAGAPSSADRTDVESTNASARDAGRDDVAYTPVDEPRAGTFAEPGVRVESVESRPSRSEEAGTGEINPVGADPIDEAGAAHDEQHGSRDATGAQSDEIHPVGSVPESDESPSFGEPAADAASLAAAQRSEQVVSESDAERRAQGATPVRATEAGAARDTEIVSHPAVDHRVPLPRGDVRHSMTEEDVEAEAHYHPEYSAYATPQVEHETTPEVSDTATPENDDAALMTEATHRESEPSTPISSDEQHITTPSDDAYDTRLQGFDASADDEFDPFAADAPVEPAAGAPQTQTPEVGALRRVAPANEEAAREREPKDAWSATGAPAPVAAELARRAEERERAAAEAPREADSTTATTNALPSDGEEHRPTHLTESAQAETPAPTEGAATPVATQEETPVTHTDAVASNDNTAAALERPEPIESAAPIDSLERPATIETPKPLPKREDKSRKGILRRIFRG